jgi:hypothetical protein
MARRGKVRRTAQQWSEILERWETSGQSAREFGEQNGIEAERLWWWKWKLGSCLKAELGATMSREEEAPQFLPVRVIHRAEASEPNVPGIGAPIEILVEQRHAVRVGPGFDEDTLRRVLTVLRSVEVA